MSVDAQIARCQPTDDQSTPQCALPGCRHAVPDPGWPCPCCLATFGNMLREISSAQAIDGPSPPSSTRPLTTPPAATTTPNRPVPGPVTPNSGVTATLSGTKEHKQNQTCWLCTERRTCTREEHGWECRECRKIT